MQVGGRSRKLKMANYEGLMLPLEQDVAPLAIAEGVHIRDCFCSILINAEPILRPFVPYSTYLVRILKLSTILTFGWTLLFTTQATLLAMGHMNLKGAKQDQNGRN